MANMSYCRFENTAGDMRDCISAIKEAREEGKSLTEFRASLSSSNERDAFDSFADLCRWFIDETESLDDDE